ncbi:MAG: tetratricopeptide (TPR) repeat protein [Bradymonadia bacterium]|jgi:tetratricopeptide (TPR) repeat protein
MRSNVRCIAQLADIDGIGYTQAMRMMSIVACFAATLPAVAQADARTSAQGEYAKGTAAFQARDYPRALARFEKAFKLDSSPVLLFNIARCHEEMGDVAQARDNFRAYLERVPDAADRADVERRIRVMQAVALRSTPPPPVAPRSEPPRSAPPRPAPPPDPPYLAWGVMAGGVVATGVGLYLGLHAADAETQYTAELRDAARKRRLGDDAESAALRANVAFGIGGALLVGGAVLWWLGAADAPVQVGVSPDGVGVSGQF